MLRSFAALLFALLVALPAPALAADDAVAGGPRCTGLPAPEPEPTTWERLDKGFADWVVGPLATLIMFDVVFWDDKLPLGDGVGTFTDAPGGGREEVTGWDPVEGYRYQRILDCPPGTLVPVLERPLAQDYGAVSGVFVNLDAGLVFAIKSRPVDLQRLGLEPWVSPDGQDVPYTEPLLLGRERPDHPWLQRVEGAARIPFTVDRAHGVVVEEQVPVEPAMIPLAAGMKVKADGHEGTLVATGLDNLEVRLDDGRTSRAALPRPGEIKLPAVVAWLVFGALFFTLRMMFISVRGFLHAIEVVRGRYDDPAHPGEVSHFQALSAALSATVGLGNIAGVAVAIGLGGPGAVFWMTIAGLLGMSSKFTEVSLGQMYRVIGPDGRVSGGPMHYLSRGLAELGLGGLGKVLAVIFALMCIGGSFGGGNMFQANQSYAAISHLVPGLPSWLFGLMMAVSVAVVILGGIKRIGSAAGVIVPVMCGVYILAALWIVLLHLGDVPAAMNHIFTQAFTAEAGFGGVVGTLVVGFQRASFSNEAGVGSASIAHSAASTDQPIREGMVALLEPFIDTVVVCNMTALVVVLTGARAEKSDIVVTMDAFGTVIDWFPFVLAFAATMFAYSTMISWSYYGERCATWLFGDAASTPYKVVFLGFTFLGSVLNLGSVLDFSDLMILGMAFPNILGCLLLSGKVKAALDRYLQKLRDGDFPTYSPPVPELEP